MSDFDFRTVPWILCRPGAAADLGAILSERFGVRRVLAVTDKGLVGTGLVTRLTERLSAAGVAAAVFDAVAADPPEAVVREGVAAAKRSKAQAVIGFGGGSSMDVAKLAAVLARQDRPLEDIYGIDKASVGIGAGIGGGIGSGAAAGGRLPLLQVPTTAGTGSEVTPIAIVTRGEGVKAGVVDPLLYADLALLDAELTVGLPRAATAATGIDAMVHAIEAYTSAHKKNPISDALARKALALLAGAVERACADGADKAARRDMLLGAMLAGQAFANAPVAAVHALAYPIGGFFHVAHGLSNALVLPHVLRFNLPAAAPAYAELAGIVVPEAKGSAQARAEALIARLEAMAEAVGLERRLSEVGIGEGDLTRLAAAAMEQTRLLVNNPRPVTEADALAIYKAAL